MTISRLSTGLLFRDQFDRANGPPGANWTIGGGAWVIENGMLKATVVGGGEGTISCFGFAATVDQHVQCLLARDNIGSFMSLFFRCAAPNWFLADVGGTSDGLDPNTVRLYRHTVGGYTRIGGGWPRNLAHPRLFNRVNASAIGSAQRAWIDGDSLTGAADGSIPEAGVIAFDFYNAAEGNAYVKDVIVCNSRNVTISGVPAGYKIQVGDSLMSAASTGADLTVDILGAQMPCAAMVFDATGTVVDAMFGVFGGDHLNYVASAAVDTTVPMRTQTGLLFADNFNRADGPVANGWGFNAAAAPATAVISGNELHVYGGGDGTMLAAPPDVLNIVSQFKYDHGVNGDAGGWNSAYAFSTENGYLLHLPAAALRLYRRDGGSYPNLVDIPRPHPGGTRFHYKMLTVPSTQKVWSGPEESSNPRSLWINTHDSNLLISGRAGPRLGPNPGAPGTIWDDVVMYKANHVRVRGLPTGSIISIDGKSAVSKGGDAVVDLGPSFCPAVLLIFDSTGAPLRAISGVYGGDEFEWATPPALALPAVAGVKTLDIDPHTFDLAVKGDGWWLNGIITPVSGVNVLPVYHRRAFPTGRPSIRTDITRVSGFSVARPVQDDFTIYLAGIFYVGSGAGGLWYQNGALIDCEIGGSTNDFGINLRADGRLIAGTGAPDNGTIGTKVLTDGLPHIIVVKRVSATGRFQVWVDDVLDIDFVGRVGALSANPTMYFGVSPSVGQTTTDYGRIVAYTTAHTDADRLAMTSVLKAIYISSAPNKPVITVDRLSDSSLRLTGSAFVNVLGAHAASQWQVTLDDDPTFATPIFDSGFDPVHLLTIDATGLSGVHVLSRVRYESDSGDLSDWSDPVTILLGRLFSYPISRLPWAPRFIIGASTFELSQPVTRWIPGERNTGATARTATGVRAGQTRLRRYTLGMNLRFRDTEWPIVREFITKAQVAGSFRWQPRSEMTIVGMPSEFIVSLDSPRVTDVLRPVRDQQYQQMMSLPIVLVTRNPLAAYYFGLGEINPDDGTGGGDGEEPPPSDFGTTFIGIGPPGVYDGVTVDIVPYYTGTLFNGRWVMNSKPQIPGHEPRADTSQSETIDIYFSSPVSSVTITCFDAQYPGDFMIAYNAADVELGRVDFTYSTGTRTLTYPGIRHIRLTAALGDFIAYYDISFTH